jgi:DNA replication protein DnaC
LESLNKTFHPSLTCAQLSLFLPHHLRPRTPLSVFHGPSGPGESLIRQATALHVSNTGFTLLYHSNFALVWELKSGQTQADLDRIPNRHRKLGLAIIDDLGARSFRVKEVGDVPESDHANV